MTPDDTTLLRALVAAARYYNDRAARYDRLKLASNAEQMRRWERETRDLHARLVTEQAYKRQADKQAEARNRADLLA